MRALPIFDGLMLARRMGLGDHGACIRGLHKLQGRWFLLAFQLQLRIYIVVSGCFT